jgi:DNA gyrase subunit A
VKGIELEDGDSVIGAVVVPMTTVTVQGAEQRVTKDPGLCLLTITEKGLGKRTPIDEYRVQPEGAPAYSQSRGGKGRADIKITDKGGRSVAALGVQSTDDVVVITKGGQLVRMPAMEIRECGRSTQGVRVASLNEGDRVVSAARVPNLDPAAAGTLPGPEASSGQPGTIPGQAPATDSGSEADHGT